MNDFETVRETLLVEYPEAPSEEERHDGLAALDRIEAEVERLRAHHQEEHDYWEKRHMEREREVEQLRADTEHLRAALGSVEYERLRAALEQIADKGKYGCCRPTLYPDAPVCSHDIARDALAEEKA